MKSYREPQYSRIRESQEETLWGKGWGALADPAEGHCSEEFDSRSKDTASWNSVSYPYKQLPHGVQFLRAAFE